MNQPTLKAIVEELKTALCNCVVGKIFQLAPASFAIDFRRRDGGYLFVSAEPALPRLYLIERPVRELEKGSKTLDGFGQALRVNLTGAKLIQVSQDASERVVRFSFARQEDTGETTQPVWVVQLTGRSANLFLLDDQDYVTHSQRTMSGPGQQIGELYSAPAGHINDETGESQFGKADFSSLSAAADHYYLALEAERSFDNQAAAARTRLRQDTSRLQKLTRRLRSDLTQHGNAEEHKRSGDLLLANISTAVRKGKTVSLQDFYSEHVPTIELEVDENTTLQAAAASYFARYGKARRAAEQIGKRLAEVEAKLSRLALDQEALEKMIATRDQDALNHLLLALNPKSRKVPAGRVPRKEQAGIPGVRRYLSSDEYEVLVGRAARDNDNLTFRVARPQDLWLHAADYPGSHVIVRNPSRKEIPQRTLIEAAQLAAKFSQANHDTRVNVNYTQQKFVSRIKGAAPGLVRLASFRTITVEPKEGIARI